jgi:hypothetical protein
VRDGSEKIGVVKPSLQDSRSGSVQMTHGFGKSRQTGTAAPHPKAGERDAGRPEIVAEYSGLDHRDDFIAEARWIKMSDNIDQGALGPSGVQAVDEMADADHKGSPQPLSTRAGASPAAIATHWKFECPISGVG